MTREQMLARQNEILQAARAESRAMTAEERAEFDTLQRSIEALDRAGATAGGEGSSRGAAAGEGEGNGDEGGEGNGDGARSAVENERARIRQIEEMCRDFGMNEQVRGFIDNGTTVEQVRTAVIEHMRQASAPVHTGVSIGDSAEDKFRRAAVDSLLLKAGLQIENPADGARQMIGMRMRDLAIECLQMDGTSERGLNRRNSDELYSLLSRGFYNPEAAFPAILDQTIEKAYREGHKKVAVTFDRFTKKGSLPDFKTHDNNYLAGPVGEFLEVPEGGELKHDVFGDEKLPTRKLKTYGRQFTLTRQAFINDDIDLVTRIPAKYAASARKTQNKQCYQILVNNPAIYDGTALFSSAHSNLLAKGTGITKEAVQGMILALQNQTDQFGEATIIRPAIIIVPSGYMFDMYTLFYSPTISTSGNTQAVNPLYRYKDSITVVEDPTINALCGGFGNVMPWWLLGAKDDTDFIEVDYLNGQEIPTIRRMETPGTLGFVWDIYLDWGISVMDYRGAIKNPGIEVKNPIELA